MEIADKRRPFRALLRDRPRGDLANAVHTQPLDLRSFAKLLAAELDEGRMIELERDLQAEITSIQLRPGIDKIWKGLRGEGLKIGIYSNIAMPYGKPLVAALPGYPDTLVVSYEAGLSKPDPAIFQLACDRLNLAPNEILFVGDTPSADIDGPRAIGMPAMHISEFMSRDLADSLSLASTACSPPVPPWLRRANRRDQFRTGPFQYVPILVQAPLRRIGEGRSTTHISAPAWLVIDQIKGRRVWTSDACI